MRNLLAVILLVVFSLQATVVVVGERFVSKDNVGYVVVMADDFSPLQASADATDNDTQLSSSDIEELSDYMPIELLIPVGNSRAFLISPSETAYLPADLQGLRPPPRA